MGVAGGIFFTRIEAQAFVLDLKEVDKLRHVLVRHFWFGIGIWLNRSRLNCGRIPGVDHFARVGEPLFNQAFGRVTSPRLDRPELAVAPADVVTGVTARPEQVRAIVFRHHLRRHRVALPLARIIPSKSP